MATKAQVIDDYFRSKNYYSWIPYRNIGQTIVDEVDRMGPSGLYLSTACALVEKESGGKNIFGCDWGSQWTNTPPYCQVEVTRDRVQSLIANVQAGGGQNGIGYTQLTSIDFVYQAEKLGGAHIPAYNMRVGFNFLLTLIQNLGWPQGAAAYNAGPGNYQSVMPTYGASMKALEREWASRLESGTGGGTPPPTPPSSEKTYYIVRTKNRIYDRAEADRIFKSLDSTPHKGVIVTRKEKVAPELSNTEKAINYGLKLNAKAPKYWCWDGGSLDRWVAGRPAAVDGPPPPVDQVKKLFCADLNSLMLRAIGKPVPKNGIYPGGTRAFRLAYQNKMVPFRLEEFRRGDVPFVDFQARGANFEGHIGVALGGPDDPILQSFARDCQSLEPGLNKDYTLRQSHDGGYYTHRIPREAIWG